MSYTPNVPLIGQSLGASRPIINSNFQYVNTWANVNHYFNVTNGGRHKFVEMPSLGAVPSPLTSNETTIYAKQGTSSSSQLYSTNGTSGNEYPITAMSTGNFAKFAIADAANNYWGWSFIAGNLVINWGYITLLKQGMATPVTFARSFSANPFSITLGYATDEGNSPGSNSCFVKQGSESATGFSIVQSSSSSSRSAYWLAIGPVS